MIFNYQHLDLKSLQQAGVIPNWNQFPNGCLLSKRVFYVNVGFPVKASCRSHKNYGKLKFASQEILLLTMEMLMMMTRIAKFILKSLKVWYIHGPCHCFWQMTAFFCGFAFHGIPKNNKLSFILVHKKGWNPASPTIGCWSGGRALFLLKDRR